MTDTSLIERWQRIRREFFDGPCAPEYVAEREVIAKAIDDTIAALTTPTSGEVAVAVSLHSNENSVCYAPPTADLLQRLDRENQRMENQLAAGVHSCSPYCERPMCVMRRKLDLVERQRDEYENLIERVTRDFGCACAFTYARGIKRIRAMEESK